MASIAGIADSLSMEEIPVKLRCASCNKLAVDAFRTPCCDQSICESCHDTLPITCPICLHEPVKSEDCKPNKALRITIKAFLKKKTMDREAAAKKESAGKAPTPAIQPAAPIETTSKSPIAPPPESVGGKVLGSQEGQAVPPSNPTGPLVPSLESKADIPRPSIEASEEKEVEARENTAEEAKPITEANAGIAQIVEQSSQDPQQLESNKGPQGIALNGTNVMVPNMPMNGMMDINHMMQFMPNGMPNGMMGAFPNMMSMPGMAMDPMNMAQGMYGGFAGQDFSGMSGMNGGMGFPSGQGAYGGYNGQSGAWSAGQDAFNQNAYGAVSGGFGAQSGYSDYSMSPQGNFNNVHQQQYPNNDYNSGHNGYGYQGRGRGRGRGFYNAGRGRGGYNQSHTGYDTKYQQYQEQMPKQYPQPSTSINGNNAQDKGTKELPSESHSNVEASQPVDAPVADEKGSRDTDVDSEETGPQTQNRPVPEISSNTAVEASETVSQTDQDHRAQSKQQNAQERADKQPLNNLETSKDVSTNPSVNSDGPLGSSAMPPPPLAVAPSNQVSPKSEPLFTPNFTFRGRGRGYPRGGFDPRGGMRGRSSAYSIGGNVGHVSPNSSLPINQKPVIPPVEPKGLGVVGAPTGPKALREGASAVGSRGGRGFSIVGRASAVAHARGGGREPSRSPSRSRSRSPSRKSRHHRSHRHRSPSDERSDDEHEKKRERRHRRSRKYEDESESESEEESHKRSSHRRHRDENEDHESRRSSHRSHRSHRDKDRDRHSEHRSSRKHSISLEDRIELQIPTGPKADRPIEPEYDSNHSPGRKRREREEDDDDHGRKRSRKDHDRKEDKENHRSKHSHGDASETDAYGRTLDRPKESTSKPTADPYTLEREARTKERVQRENQRRLQMDGKASKGGALGRRVSYQYENEASSEARTSRVESEREASRWG